MTESEHKQTIVFVDDEMPILNALRRVVMGKLDVNIHCLASAQQALDFIVNNDVSVLVSDVRMPEMDGIELMTKVYAGWPHIERVLLTGFADMEATVEAINHGRVSYYLEKPWDNQRLLEVLGHCLAVASLRDDKQRLEQAVKRQNEQLRLANETLEERVIERTQQLHDAYDSTVRTFVSLVESRMQGRQHRSHEVVELCDLVASELNIDEPHSRALRLAADLRNIGKISFSDQLLETSYYQMTKEQHNEYCQHPVLAHAAISLLQPLAETADILLQIKERVDGKGYPSGVAVADTPLTVKVLSLVNDYFELMDGQLQNRALTMAEALLYLEGDLAASYDEQVFSVFKSCVQGMAHDTAEEGVHCVTAYSLQEGDSLVKDLVTKKGLFVLAKGCVVDAALIEKLNNLERNLNEAFDIFVVSK